MKKRYFKSIAALVAAVCLTGMPASAETKVLVHGAEGDPAGVHITTASKITFGAEGIVVATSETETQTFPYASTAKLSFATEQSGIGNLAAATDGIRLLENPVADELRFALPADFEAADLAVYGLSGQTLVSVAHWTGAPVNVASLTPGIYLAKINSTTIKFVKK